MEKKIWSKPEVSFVQFAANDYISACGASYEASLICMLPNNPIKDDGYSGYSCGEANHQNGGNCSNTHPDYGTGCNSFKDENGNWHGTCATGTNFYVFDGNNNAGSGFEGTNDIWDVQLGQKIDYTPGYEHNFFTNGIGTLLENLTTEGYYLVSWLSGVFGTTEWRRHYGYADVSDVIQQGNPNRS